MFLLYKLSITACSLTLLVFGARPRDPRKRWTAENYEDTETGDQQSTNAVLTAVAGNGFYDTREELHGDALLERKSNSSSDVRAGALTDDSQLPVSLLSARSRENSQRANHTLLRKSWLKRKPKIKGKEKSKAKDDKGGKKDEELKAADSVQSMGAEESDTDMDESESESEEKKDKDKEKKGDEEKKKKDAEDLKKAEKALSDDSAKTWKDLEKISKAYMIIVIIYVVVSLGSAFVVAYMHNHYSGEGMPGTHIGVQSIGCALCCFPCGCLAFCMPIDPLVGDAVSAGSSGDRRSKKDKKSRR